MKNNIDVTSHTKIVTCTNTPICIYKLLRKNYGENELFLLESMNGPLKDCKKSIIAFDPVVTVSISDKSITLTGHDEVINFIQSHENLKSYSIDNNIIRINNNYEFLDLLRTIESIFSITHSGVAADIYFGFFGYFGYDTIHFFEQIEKKLSRNHDYSTVNLTIYRGIINIDIKENSVNLTLNDSSFFSGSERETIEKLISTPTKYDFKDNFSYSSEVYPTITKEQYFSWFNKAKRHIDIGDVYQIQLGHEIIIDSKIEPFTVYLRMREFNPSPYMYFFKTTEGLYVIGSSPEMFITLTSENEIIMRPIAGTIRNSEDHKIKEKNRKKLLSDEKENAEHLMLVDLCRNDIARICEPKTLNVDELMITEEYSHVIHIVSNVSGHLKGKADKYDILSATFPAGTMTGTPKIKAIEIIEDTEASPRGIYAGCVGFFGFNNTLVSALCIRTAIYYEGKYSIRASGGIVEDSSKEGEWAETISKLSSTYFAITNKELNLESFIN